MPLPALRIAPERQLPGAAPRPGEGGAQAGQRRLGSARLVPAPPPGGGAGLYQGAAIAERGCRREHRAAPPPRRRGGGRGPGGGRDTRGRAVPGPPVAHGCARRGGGPLRTWGPALLCEGCLGLPLPQGRTPHGSEPAQAALQLAVSPYGPL